MKRNKRKQGFRRKFAGRWSVAICMILIIGLIVNGCSAGDESGKDSDQPLKDNDKLQVVTTIFPAYDFARQVGGEQAEVKMLLSPGEELHSYEPSPKDIIAIEQCDIFIYVGGESDTWVEDILESIDTSGMTIIAMMDVVDALTEVTVEGMDTGGIFGGHSHDHEEEHDHVDIDENRQSKDYDSADETGAHGEEICADEHIHEDGEICTDEHVHAEYDEHVWTSPENAKQIVKQIAEEMVKNDPGGESEYRANETEYIAEIDKLTAELLTIREQAVRTTIIVGDRFPYRYLAEFMDLDYYAAFPGCAEETEPSAKTVAFLIDKVKEEQIPVVFHGEFSSHLMAQRISEEAGAVPMLLHSCHNVTKDEFEAGVTYLELMWANAENLREALN